ncbi:hypothetical protein P3T76_007118 [Phytophthora citrophthora]|uniref:Uncharacterized protein n=1 Tax=Phytophthora citrophthora TaxID=4793 RepID=A0AAD9GME8_9STRA|nr:hypothetical protein P3T76_007118 [Phytophthora citrophthora]
MEMSKPKTWTDGPITTPLECFRQGKDSISMGNALAELAMRLVDAQDREDFRKADGVTAIVDQLARLLEEQATMNYAWQTSEVFGSPWEEYQVHDSLQFTLVALCHASIDAEIAVEMHELNILETLFQTLSVLSERLSDYVPFVLEACRNLCGSDGYSSLRTDFVQSMWEILLSNEAPTHWNELAAETLTNIAAIDSSRAAATPLRISATLSLFLHVLHSDSTDFSLALSDLLCNLCCDQASCLLVICELDTCRPRGHLRHSGVVYLAELTEKAQDDALKQSMEALVHNLSWSDPTGKRSVQKLALCSFMTRFALGPAISS